MVTLGRWKSQKTKTKKLIQIIYSVIYQEFLKNNVMKM